MTEAFKTSLCAKKGTFSDLYSLKCISSLKNQIKETKKRVLEKMQDVRKDQKTEVRMKAKVNKV